MSASAKKTYRPETRLVQSGTLRSQFGETSEAMFLTQGYVYDTAAQAEARFKGEDPGYQYSRFANPTVDMFERRMAAFEGAEAARATATGMAAVTISLVGQLKAGDHVVASKAMFGSCRYVVEDYLPRFGVASTLVDGCNLEAWKNAVRPNTKTFFLESPTNPALEVIDIAEVAKIAHAAGATLVVDNVFATPLFLVLLVVEITDVTLAIDSIPAIFGITRDPFTDGLGWGGLMPQRGWRGISFSFRRLELCGRPRLLSHGGLRGFLRLGCLRVTQRLQDRTGAIGVSRGLGPLFRRFGVLPRLLEMARSVV